MNWRVAYSALNYANTLTFTGELERARVLVREAMESGVTTATFKTKAAAVGAAGTPARRPATARRVRGRRRSRSRDPFGGAARIASVSSAFAELRLAQGVPEAAHALLDAALEAMPQPHRCTSLALQAGGCDDARTRAAAERLLSAASAAPADTPRLPFAARARSRRHRSGDRRRRLAAAAATAARSAGWRAFTKPARSKRLGPSMPHRTRARERAPAEPPPNGSGAPGRRRPTNRVIADRLHISEHTVEHHLSTIFTRLGLHSRSALAAHVERSSTT